MKLEELNKRANVLVALAQNRLKKMKEGNDKKEYDARNFMETTINIAEVLALYQKERLSEEEKNKLAERFGEINEIVRNMEAIFNNVYGAVSMWNQSSSAVSLYNYVKRSAKKGEYKIPEDVFIAFIKKEILVATFEISFTIWQQKKRNPDYQYKETERIENLLQMYDIYKEAVGVQMQEDTYQGPQFGKCLERIFTTIKQDSTIENENNKVYQK